MPKTKLHKSGHNMSIYSIPARDRITGIICYPLKCLILLRLQGVILCLFYSVQ